MFDLGIEIALEGVRKSIADLDKIRAQIDRVGDEGEKATSKVSKGFRSLSNEIPAVGRAVELITNPIVLATAAVVGFGAAFSNALGTARSFEKQVADTAAIVTTGFDTQEAQKQISALRAEFIELGNSTEFSASQAAQGAEFLGRAGFDTQQILAGLGDTLSLATVGNLELAQSADISSNILSQFRLEADELGRVVDVIAKTTTSANTNVTQLSEAFKFIGPTAAALNISLEETSAVVGILGNNGLQGSIATRALGTSLTRLAKPTKEAAGLIEELGIQGFDSQGNFVGLANLIAELEGAFEGLSTQQQQAALTTIFGAEAIQEFSIFMSTGSEQIRAYTQELEAAGAQQGQFAEEIRRAKLDNFEGSIISLKSAFEGFQIAIASGALPTLKELTLGIADTLRAITSIVNGTSTFADIFGTVGAAIDDFISKISEVAGEISDTFAGAFSGVGQEVSGFIQSGLVLLIDTLTTVVDIAGTVVTTFIELGGFLNQNREIIVALGIAYVALNAEMIAVSVATRAIAIAQGVLTGATKILTIVQAAFNVVLAANPIGLVVVAVAGLVAAFVALYRNSQTVRAGIAGLFNVLKSLISTVGQAIVNYFTGLGDVIIGVFTFDLDKITGGLSRAFEGIKSVLPNNLGKTISDSFVEGFDAKVAAEQAEEAGKEIGEGLSKGLPPVVEGAVPQSMIDALSKTTETAIEPAKETGKQIGKAIAQGINVELQTIQTGTLVDLDTDLGASFQAPPLPELTEAEQITQRLAITYDELIDRFGNANGELAGFAQTAISIGDSLNLSGDQILNLIESFEQLGNAIENTLVKGAARSFQVFGQEIGKAIATGQSFTGAFEALFKSLIDTILVEVPRLIGMHLLQIAVGLGFPAGVPFALAGLGLVAFSGISSGLLSSIGGQGRGQSLVAAEQSQIAAQSFQNAGQTRSGLTGFSGGESPVTTVTNVSISLETDGIVEEIQRQQLIDGELQRGG